MPKRGSPDSGVPRHPGNRAHAVARGPRDRRSHSPPRRRRVRPVLRPLHRQGPRRRPAADAPGPGTGHASVARRLARGQGIAPLRPGEMEHQGGDRAHHRHRARVLLPRAAVRARRHDRAPRLRRERLGAGREVRGALSCGPGGRARRGAARHPRAVPGSRRRRSRPPRDRERQRGFGARHRLDHRRPRAPPRGAAARALRRMSPALFLLLLAAAQGDTGSFVIRNFRFASGEALPELRLHYRTLGRPHHNAVLILHGTGGSGSQFLSPQFAGELYGAGQPLDTATHYVILPDNIGHGRSSKPSDGLRARFPHYAYEDMVAAQYRLVTEGLRVNHLLLVMGTSMGCMHTWIWGERYPSFMDGLVPLACLPTQIAGRNRMWRKLIMDDITTDPDWKNGDYATQPRGLRAALQLLFIAVSAPLVQQRLGPTRDSADAYIARWIDSRLAETDATDLLYQVAASRDYDPSGALERVTVPVLAINSADDFINPPELGIMERLITRAKQARYVLIPISDKTRGHGTHTVAATWKEYFAPFVASLERR